VEDVSMIGRVGSLPMLDSAVESLARAGIATEVDVIILASCSLVASLVGVRATIREEITCSSLHYNYSYVNRNKQAPKTCNCNSLRGQGTA
jgi:hypothetical protein